jgi:cytochrome P450
MKVAMSEPSSITALAGPGSGYLVLTGYREVEEVLRRSQDFVAQGGRGELAREFVHETLIDLDGDAHAAQRRLLARVMSQVQICRYEQVVGDALERYLASYRSAGPRASDVIRFDLIELARHTFWHLGATMVGIDDVDSPDRLEQLEAVVVPAAGGVTVLFAHNDHESVVLRARDGVRSFREEFYLPSRQRRQDLLAQLGHGILDEHSLPTDMLTLLLRAHPGEQYDNAVMRQCLVVVGASVSSTVSITCHALAEFESWLAAHPEDDPRSLDEDFIAQIVNETIRLHRTGNPYLIRHATREAELRSSGRVIPAGTAVAMDLRLASRDKDVFGADADEFDPYRRLAAARVKGYGLGFGTGPHVCLAKRMIVNDEADPNSPRLLDIVLRKLLLSGVRTDRTSAPVAEPHGADRFTSFPVAILPEAAAAR